MGPGGQKPVSVVNIHELEKIASRRIRSVNIHGWLFGNELLSAVTRVRHASDTFQHNANSKTRNPFQVEEVLAAKLIRK